MKPSRRRFLYTLTAAVAAVGLFGYVTRPWWHSFLIGLYTRPFLLFAALILAGGLAYARYGGGPGTFRIGLRQTRRGPGTEVDIELETSLAVKVVLVLFALVLFSGFVLDTGYTQVQVSKSLDVQEADGLPEADAERPRILPLSVAAQYASNSLQYPRYRVAVPDVSMLNGSPHFSFALAPDGLVNVFRLKGKGGMFADMATSSKRTSIMEDRLEVGPGMQLLDNYEWRLLKEKFWVTYEDPYVVPHDGRVYLAVPYVTYSFHFRLPIPYTVPHWGGTALIAPDGSIQHLSPEEARSNEVLKGQKLYPFSLSKFYVESFRYKHGIVNKWFLHRDELEVAPVPGMGNDQPFLVLTEDGIKYFLAAEPYGQAEGIYQVWVFDGRSGEVSKYQVPITDTLLGPSRAAQYVRKENPRVNWNRMEPSEPLPVVIDDTLYWQVRVVPQDSSGIAYTAFVDAESSDVTAFRSDSGIRSFLRGKQVKENVTVAPQERKNVSMVVRVLENGNVVQRFNVTGGQSLEIERAD